MESKAKSEPAFVTEVLVHAGNPVSWKVDKEVHWVVQGQCNLHKFRAKLGYMRLSQQSPMPPH